MNLTRLFLITILISLSFNVSSLHKLEDGNEDFLKLETEVLQLINNHRKSLGKNELTNNDLIRAEALKHTLNMASGKIPLSHDGFDERADKLLDRLNGNSAAENVAWGHPTAKLVVDGWLESKGHRKNIEGDFNLTGIGIARGEDRELYYTQIFIKTLKKE